MLHNLRTMSILPPCLRTFMYSYMSMFISGTYGEGHEFSITVSKYVKFYWQLRVCLDLCVININTIGYRGSNTKTFSGAFKPHGSVDIKPAPYKVINWPDRPTSLRNGCFNGRDTIDMLYKVVFGIRLPVVVEIRASYIYLMLPANISSISILLAHGWIVALV